MLLKPACCKCSQMFCHHCLFCRCFCPHALLLLIWWAPNLSSICPILFLGTEQSWQWFDGIHMFPCDLMGVWLWLLSHARVPLTHHTGQGHPEPPHTATTVPSPVRGQRNTTQGHREEDRAPRSEVRGTLVVCCLYLHCWWSSIWYSTRLHCTLLYITHNRRPDIDVHSVYEAHMVRFDWISAVHMTLWLSHNFWVI